MMIKRLPFLCILILLSITALAAQVMDKTAATVNLYKPEIITVKQLEQRIDQLQALMQPITSKKQVLEDMISEVLLKQAAEKEGIFVSDTEVIMAIKQQMGPEGVNITNDQLKTFVTQQTGIPWAAYVKQAKEQLAINNYIKMKKSKDFDNIKPPPESEIQDIFNENSHLFLNPEMVRFSQIFRDTRNLSPLDKRQARDLMYEILRDLENGVATFEKLVIKYSDDTQSRYQGGDVGYLQRNDMASQSLLGKNFFDKVFALKTGETSRVIESNIGYHIVKVTEKLSKRFLELDDPVSPGAKETVRDRIVALKLLEKQQIVLQKAVDELVKVMKQDAEIVIYERNLE